MTYPDGKPVTEGMVVFEGKDQEIDLNAHRPPEFDAWRWGRLEETPELIVPFKRKVYDEVVRAFAVFAAG